MNEPCKFEEDVILLREAVPRIEKKVDKLVDLLQGDNGQGVITKVALVKQSLDKAWWWLGGVSLGILGLISYRIWG